MSSAVADPAGSGPSAEWARLERSVARLVGARDAWRDRARAAERRVQELEASLHALSGGSLDVAELSQRVDRLTQENRLLRRKIEAARGRVGRLLRRVDTLREAR